jgi:hypothetical protein
MEKVQNTHKDYTIFYKHFIDALNKKELPKKVFLVGAGTSQEIFEEIDYDSSVVIFVNTENMQRRDFAIQKSYMHKCHIIVSGSLEDVPKDYSGKVFVIPVFFMWIDFTNEYVINALKSKICYSLNDRKGICFIARDDVGKNRKRMLRYFRNKEVAIDCPSKIGNNCASIESRNISKNEFLQNYIYNICPENTYHSGYVTEKIFDACIAGCIPIYFGNGIEHIEKIINMDRVLITYKGFKTHKYDDIHKKLTFLQNKEELEKFFYQPVFQENAYEEIKKLFDKIEEIVEYITN